MTDLDLPLPLRRLVIATRIRPHPEFTKNPGKFASRHGVPLVNWNRPRTNFRKTQGPDNDFSREVTGTKTSYNLIGRDVVRLRIEGDGKGEWLTRIEMNPALALYGIEDRPLVAGDLLRAQSLLREIVTPLLAEPGDGQHVVPGDFGNHEPIAFWREIETRQRIPGVDLSLVSGLGHPTTGPAHGSTPRYARLGDKKHGLQIELERRKRAGGAEADEPDLLATVLLREDSLIQAFAGRRVITRFGDITRLVRLRPGDLAEVHRELLSHIEGSYLPVPAKWKSQRQDDVARALALLARITPLSIDELLKMDEDIRKPSESTLKRLRKAVRQECDRLQPQPLQDLIAATLGRVSS